ncbi:Ger(x)C family spore germination protein [Halalkalibacterium ligniniphilum]|uniref:Ger(x)C family spore germination protein n=1 Tax=Halalkalibacterium ligniniphilum TaxID=1134413 RepID=UPI000344EC82|nr:Ger(x)C family spore germination protein [Halalkalibacterium ligniniphilum]
MKTIIIVFVVALICCGCSDKKLLEDVGFIHALALDIHKIEEFEEDGALQFTVAIPQIEPEAEKDSEVLTTIARSNKEAILNVSRQSERDLVTGQIRNVLYGVNLAKNGLQDQIEALNRDPIFGSRLKISIINGHASELLENEYPAHPRSSKYIDKLLDKEIRNMMVPESRLYQFTRDLYEEGIDPVAPLLKHANDEIVADGIALFKNDQYITKIDPNDARVFFFLKGGSSEGTLHFDMEDPATKKKAQLLYEGIKNRRKINVSNDADGGNIQAEIDINVRGSILEYTGSLNLTDEKDMRKLESMIENHIKEVALRLIRTMQDNEVDSIGIGIFVKNSLSYEQWKQLNWRKAFPTIDVKVNVNAEIKNTGFIKNALKVKEQEME